MDKKNKKSKKVINQYGAFVTMPLAQCERKEPDTNEAIPSHEDVEIAKKWVDSNEK